MHGHTEVRSSADGTKALEPVAGPLALGIFGLGIIGTGFLAVPVLAGSAANAVTEVFGWRAGLSKRFQDARGFYPIIILATALGTSLSLAEVDAIKALVVSAIINGVIAVPVMIIMMIIGRSSRLMGTLVVRRPIQNCLAQGFGERDLKTPRPRVHGHSMAIEGECRLRQCARQGRSRPIRNPRVPRPGRGRGG